MHTMQLGIFLIVNAEAILWLGGFRLRMGQATSWKQALKELFADFREWCRQNKVGCSQRPWGLRSFHCGDNLSKPSEYPWINCKAYNSRCVLAWAADFFVAFGILGFLLFPVFQIYSKTQPYTFNP